MPVIVSFVGQSFASRLHFNSSSKLARHQITESIAYRLGIFCSLPLIMHARGSLSLAVQGASLIQNGKGRGRLLTITAGKMQSLSCSLATIAAANRAFETIRELIVDTHCR